MALSRTELLALGLAGLGTAGLVFALTRKPGPATAPACSAGQVAIQLQAQGPGSASGCGGSTRSQVTVCPWQGETCVYTASPDFGASFRGWQGPDGASSSDNPITLAAYASGYVRAVFDPPLGLPWWP